MDLLPIIILAGICIVIGFIGGILVASLRQTDRVEPSGGASPEDAGEEVLRLVRDPQSGVVRPMLGARALESPNALPADKHGELAEALATLNRWMGAAPGSEGSTARREESHVAGEAAAQAGAEPAVAGANPATLAPQDSRGRTQSGDEPLAGDQTPGWGEVSVSVASDSRSMIMQLPEAEPVKPASMNVFKSLFNVARAEVTHKLEQPAPSIAAQVDEILQAKLVGTELEKRAIRLLDLPNQGMVILVGLEKYQDIEAIPDEAIKAVLRASVAEWEAAMLAKGRPQGRRSSA